MSYDPFGPEAECNWLQDELDECKLALDQSAIRESQQKELIIEKETQLAQAQAEIADLKDISHDWRSAAEEALAEITRLQGVVTDLGKSIQKRVAIQSGGECVVVRRDKLTVLAELLEYGFCPNCGSRRDGEHHPDCQFRENELPWLKAALAVKP